MSTTAETDEQRTEEIRVGQKKLYLMVNFEPGRTKVLCDCNSRPGALIAFYIPTGVVDELVARANGSGERRSIQAILPETPPALREIFMTGITPAEFGWPDGRVRSAWELKESYGYEFEAEAMVSSRDLEYLSGLSDEELQVAVVEDAENPEAGIADIRYLAEKGSSTDAALAKGILARLKIVDQEVEPLPEPRDGPVAGSGRSA